MGKGMTTKKKKAKTNGKMMSLSKRQLEAIKQDIAKKATQKAMLICIGVMADYRDMTEDDICKFAEEIDKLKNWEEKDWISLRDLADVIEKRTGLKFWG